MSERARVAGILVAEYEYWASQLPEKRNEDTELSSLSCIMASGAIANVIAAVMEELSVDEFRDRVKARDGRRPMFQNE